MIEIKIAFYNEKDWPRFLAIVDDKENLHEHWEDWHQSYCKTVADLQKLKFVVKKKVIDLDKLIAYCKEHKLRNNGETRSRFTRLG